MTKEASARNSAASPALSRVTVRVPASTSNLGPGFDTLGLALTLYNTFTVEVLDEGDSAAPVVVKGTRGAGLPTDRSNLIHSLLRSRLQDDELVSRLRITIDCNIPLTAGLGSSGTATIAACWLAQALATGHGSRERTLIEATQIEGHPDNVSPSLLGGFIVSGTTANKRKVLTQRIKWPDDWQTIFLLPQYSLSTKHARSVLPKRVPHVDATHNVQRVSLLLGAIVNQDEDTFREAMQDKLHEPYRQELVPELGALRKLIPDWPVIGSALSGAGPSIMLVTTKRHHAEVLAELKKWTASQAKPPEIFDLRVDQEGLKQIDD